MKKRAYLLVFLLPAYMLLSYSSGAPYGYTGSPGDDNHTCEHCHSANGNSYTPSIALQNMPASYVPGQTYRIHFTVSGTSNPKFGFEATVEDASNQKQGSFAGVNGGTQAIENNTYITHTSSGTNAGDWLFDWTAPSSGQGTLKMYYAVNLANGNGSSTGDYIVNDFAEIPENTSGVKEIKEATFILYPNPATSYLQLKNLTPGKYTISAVDIQGRIYPLEQINRIIDISFLPTGQYILQVENQKIKYIKSFIKN